MYGYIYIYIYVVMYIHLCAMPYDATFSVLCLCVFLQWVDVTLRQTCKAYIHTYELATLHVCNITCLQGSSSAYMLATLHVCLHAGIHGCVNRWIGGRTMDTCMHVYVCTYIHASTHTYIHTYTHAYIHANMGFY